MNCTIIDSPNHYLEKFSTYRHHHILVHVLIKEKESNQRQSKLDLGLNRTNDFQKQDHRRRFRRRSILFALFVLFFLLELLSALYYTPRKMIRFVSVAFFIIVRVFGITLISLLCGERVPVPSHRN